MGLTFTLLPALSVSAWWRSQVLLTPKKHLGFAKRLDLTGEHQTPSSGPGQLGRDTGLRKSKPLTSVVRMTLNERTLII